MAKKERISKTTEWLMIGTALFYDVVSLIPFGNWITFVLTPLTFGTWFLVHDAGWVGFFNYKKAGTDVTVYIIEAIPAVSLLPGITVRVFRAVKMIQLEDREHNEKQSSRSVVGRIGPRSIQQKAA